jgi:hypothetical protein
MNNFQIIAAYAAIVLTPCAALVLFQWLVNRHYDRQAQREMDKARHPSMRVRSDVRVLNLTIDDFYGCNRCFTGTHAVKAANGRCLCCSFVLPNSYVGPC